MHTLSCMLLWVALLSCLLGALAAPPVQLFVPKIDERTLVADHWQLKTKWLYKKDQNRPPVEDLSLLPDRTATTAQGPGFWRVATNNLTGAQTVVVEVPRGKGGDTFVIYEVPVAPGTMYPGSVRFTGEGEIAFESPKGRRRIGSVRMDIRRRYKNLLDHAFSR